MRENGFDLTHPRRAARINKTAREILTPGAKADPTAKGTENQQKQRTRQLNVSHFFSFFFPTELSVL